MTPPFFPWGGPRTPLSLPPPVGWLDRKEKQGEGGKDPPVAPQLHRGGRGGAESDPPGA